MAVSHWLILKWLTFIIPCLQQGVPEAVIFNLQNRFEGIVAVFLVWNVKMLYFDKCIT